MFSRKMMFKRNKQMEVTWSKVRKLCKAIQRKRPGLLTKGVLLIKVFFKSILLFV
jgi:hypothetical protein